MNWKKIKKKEKVEKSPKVKKVAKKTSTRVVSIGFILLLVFSTVGVIRVNVVSSTMAKTIKKVEKLELQEQPEEKEEVDMVNLTYYTKSFVNEYINVDSEDKAKDKRLERLGSYVSFDVGLLDEGIKGKYKRTLKSMDVTNVEETSESVLVYVTISYQEQVDKKTTDTTEVMVVPVVEKNNLFAVVSRPYFIAVSIPKGKTEALKEVEKPLDVDSKERKKMETFLKLFFSKYAEGNKEELALLMKEPVLTSGSTAFKEIESGSLNYFEVDDKELQGIQVSVVFENKETKTTHVENFSLWVGETENSQFIYTLKNYFTESRE